MVAGATNMRRLSLFFCTVVWVAGQPRTPEPSEQPMCEGGAEKANTYRFRLVSAPPSPVFVGGLGVDPQLRIFCIAIHESPTYGSGCQTPSLPVLCKDDIQEGNCEALAEYTYERNKEVVRGSSNGRDTRWILLWEGRSKPDSCYPRDVTMRILYQTESPAGRSTVLAVASIILVSVLFIAVGAFGLSRVLEKSKQLREAKKQTIQGPRVGTGDEGWAQGMGMCPNCGAGQRMPHEGCGPLTKMLCRDCGRTSVGWVPASRSAVRQTDTDTNTEGLPEGVDLKMLQGITTAEIAAMYDPALLQAQRSSKHHSTSNLNPLETSFPPSPAHTGRTQPFPSPSPPPPRQTPFSDPVFAPTYM